MSGCRDARCAGCVRTGAGIETPVETAISASADQNLPSRRMLVRWPWMRTLRGESKSIADTDYSRFNFL